MSGQRNAVPTARLPILHYRGRTIARAGVGTHCVGVTFEVFWQIAHPLATKRGLTVRDIHKLRRIWFVPKAGGKGPAEALPRFGLGFEVKNKERARPGDFVQVWNFGRSFGHSAIFLRWVRDSNQRIIGFRYWSSQPLIWIPMLPT